MNETVTRVRPRNTLGKILDSWIFKSFLFGLAVGAFELVVVGIHYIVGYEASTTTMTITMTAFIFGAIYPFITQFSALPFFYSYPILLVSQSFRERLKEVSYPIKYISASVVAYVAGYSIVAGLSVFSTPLLHSLLNIQ